MGKMSSQFKSEIKLLPFMLCKLFGGIMAVIGFTAAVVIITRKADQSLADALPSAFLGGAGIIIFMLSSRLLARRLSNSPAGNSISASRTGTSLLSWVILLLLAAAFLLFSYLITH